VGPFGTAITGSLLGLEDGGDGGSREGEDHPYREDLEGPDERTPPEREPDEREPDEEAPDEGEGQDEEEERREAGPGEGEEDKPASRKRPHRKSAPKGDD